MIGIIGAMDKEIEAISNLMEDKKIETISGIDYITGKAHGKEIVLAKCGIGKVFAAVCAQTMIIKYSPEIIINTGVAGGLAEGFGLADIAIADSVCQYDMDTTPIGDPLGLISGINMIYFESDKDFVADIEKCMKKLDINFKKGVIASGDAFVSDSVKKKHIVDSFNAIACEMEGGSIGHVCYINNTKFGVLRAISDNGDENASEDYFVVMEKACAVLFKVVDSYLAI